MVMEQQEQKKRAKLIQRQNNGITLELNTETHELWAWGKTVSPYWCDDFEGHSNRKNKFLLATNIANVTVNPYGFTIESKDFADHIRLWPHHPNAHGRDNPNWRLEPRPCCITTCKKIHEIIGISSLFLLLFFILYASSLQPGYTVRELDLQCNATITVKTSSVSMTLPGNIGFNNSKSKKKAKKHFLVRTFLSGVDDKFTESRFYDQTLNDQKRFWLNMTALPEKHFFHPNQNMSLLLAIYVPYQNLISGTDIKWFEFNVAEWKNQVSASFGEYLQHQAIFRNHYFESLTLSQIF